MALAPLAHVLYSRVMKHDPADPSWPDRDRFVLSNGHASILQYSMLYLTGYGLELDDIKAFRQWESRTPGHPEAGTHRGVEVTTGPLGQGFANAVGMAIAERLPAARFGPQARRPPHLRDRRRRLLHGRRVARGGLARRAPRARQADLRLRRQPHHDRRRHRARLQRRRRRALPGLRLGRRRARRDGQRHATPSKRRCSPPRTSPTAILLILRSHIGYPSPDHTDDHEAHGMAFDAEDVTRTKAVMGIPDEPFWAPPDLVEAYRKHAAANGAAAHSAWAHDNADDDRVAASGMRRGRRPALAGWTDAAADGRPRREDRHPQGDRVGDQRHAPVPPRPVAGAADLTGNTGTKLKTRTGAVEGQPRRAPALLRRPRARDGGGDGRHGRPRRDPAGRRHVLRVPRLHAPADPPGVVVAA